MALLEEGIDNVLFLIHVFLSFFEPVALAFDIDDSTVLQNTGKDSRGDGDIGEDLVPLGKGLVGGKDCGGILVSSGDALKEQVLPLNIHREIADFINDEHFVFARNFELVRQTVFIIGLLELLNQGVAVDVISGESMLGGNQPQF